MKWPITVWPGAVCNDWFGVIAFYACLASLAALVLLLVGTVTYLVRKEWRMHRHDEDWYDPLPPLRVFSRHRRR